MFVDDQEVEQKKRYQMLQQRGVKRIRMFVVCLLLECLLKIQRRNRREVSAAAAERAKRIRGFEKVTSLSAITRKPHPPT